MNYYERVQKSIDFIERRLEEDIDLNDAAREAFMSLPGYYRIFFALTGHSVKEYIRLRRLSLAAAELRSSGFCIIDLAVKYGFESGDAFSRAFRKATGFLPSDFRKTDRKYHFERIDVLEKYFEIQDDKIQHKYPEIKVLKRLEPMRVAYYCYFGRDPEANAFSVLGGWMKRAGLLNNGCQEEYPAFRIFGYNNPNPVGSEDEYGYEVCVTIGDKLQVKDDKVGVKLLEGGFYAVTGVKREKGGDLGNEIMKAWQRFNEWLADSRYVYGGHQWLEEHLGFDEEFCHTGGIDLYMPIAEKT